MGRRAQKCRIPFLPPAATWDGGRKNAGFRSYPLSIQVRKLQTTLQKGLPAISQFFPDYLSGPELSLLRVEVLQSVPVRAISSIFARRGPSHDTPTSTVFIPGRCPS